MFKYLSVSIALLLTSGCSSLLPLDYSGYEGADAATIHVKNARGNVGTIYITKFEYVADEACYKMDTRYELDSNFLAASGSIIRENIKAGGFYAVQRTYGGGAYIYYRTTAFIPEVGQHYYIIPGQNALEIPATLQVTPDTDDRMMQEKYPKAKQVWPAKATCKNFIGKILS